MDSASSLFRPCTLHSCSDLLGKDLGAPVVAFRDSESAYTYLKILD